MWLSDLHMEDIGHLFLQAGYDIQTISRMTPEVCNTIYLIIQIKLMM